MIEPAATALAVGRITAEDLKRLEETLARMDSAESVEELVEADDDFHRTIAGATGNAALAHSFRTSTAGPCGPASGAASPRKVL
jgi:DNA-binding FadR family transcriptional regulator